MDTMRHFHGACTGRCHEPPGAIVELLATRGVGNANVGASANPRREPNDADIEAAMRFIEYNTRATYPIESLQKQETI